MSHKLKSADCELSIEKNRRLTKNIIKCSILCVFLIYSHLVYFCIGKGKIAYLGRIYVIVFQVSR